MSSPFDMTSMSKAMTDAIRRRERLKAGQDPNAPELPPDADAVQQMTPEDQQRAAEEKNKRFAQIKRMLGFGT